MTEYGKAERSDEAKAGMDPQILVRLVTVQPHNVVQRLQAGDAVTCDPLKSSFRDYAWRKYNWIADEMERLGVHHSTSARPRWPMWAWASMFYSPVYEAMSIDSMDEDDDEDFKKDLALAARQEADPRIVMEDGKAEANDLLYLEVPADRLLFTSFEDWSAWAFITYNGLAQPPEKLANAMDVDEKLQDRWWDLSDSCSVAEKSRTWWRCDRSLADVIDACSMEFKDLFDDEGSLKAPIVQSCLWELLPCDVKRIDVGDNPLGEDVDQAKLTETAETIHSWLRANGRP